MYGTGLLTRSPAVVAVLPKWLQISVPYANAVNEYLTVVVAFLAFLELSVGRLRVVIGTVIVAGMAVAVAGIGSFVFGGSEHKFIQFNHLVTVCGLLVLLTVLAVKKLSDKFLVFLNRRVLSAGTLVFVSVALWVNLSRTLHYETPRLVNHLGFAVFLLSLGYVGVQIVSASERRLLSIEKELEVARQLQFSILPTAVPEIQNLRIAVSYRPMAAVAGDFYEFVPADGKRIGFLVADVTGHGVPAALIASMIKVAMQSVEVRAHDPREVLRGLNRIRSSNSMSNTYRRLICGLIRSMARLSIRRPGIRRCCARGKAGWSASKAMAYCLESSRIPSIPFVSSRSVQGTGFCCTPMD
jgi:phosphoserine phosphatase RsbU/P